MAEQTYTPRDADGRWAPDERRHFIPDPCPECGSMNVYVTWFNAKALSDAPGVQLAMPGSHRCMDCSRRR
jgi:hypothetical protein